MCGSVRMIASADEVSATRAQSAEIGSSSVSVAVTCWPREVRSAALASSYRFLSYGDAMWLPERCPAELALGSPGKGMG